ncbi:glycosyltransferase family 2 protein [Mucilaginibacter paludis]|uniref:Glycosyl transferase family 2 n=1 Tax=Mucilaginibacter paludis DSM 18603 TaxID=714943 RepID=H1Y2S9_9SPHI|nr:glycosyltransferase family 2 protein [Mucilaginibacter paludis]EHQ28258.1 glycosyl transferase family 2 [Mucilaginibacter paludis DSM 18603]
MSQPKAPKISIIIVTYNAVKTLQAGLDSIYAQKYPNIEVVVIDGGSTDGTLELLKDNTSKLAYWKSEPDEGIYDAMNKGLNHISGQWVYFMGADDELRDEFSEMALELKRPGALYYANVMSNGKKKSGFVNEYYQAKAGVFHQAIIYSASIFKTYRYDTRYSISADYELNMRCWRDQSIAFIYRDYVIANFNHNGASSGGEDELFASNKSNLIRQNFGLKIWLRYMFRLFKERLRGTK